MARGTGMYQAYKLRHVVNIQARSDQQDATGQQVKVWNTVATVFAAIESLTGREIEAAQASNYEVTHKVTIRYEPIVDVKMRVLLGNRIFAISSITDFEERHHMLTLYCKEGLTDG